VPCNSESLRREAVALGVAAEGRTLVFGKGSGNGVDAGRFKPTLERKEEGRRLREELGIAAEAKVIGFVGRIVRDKGIEELVTAFSKLGDRREDLHLLLVGPFEKGDEIAAATRRGIETNPRITSTGFVTDAEKYYHAMDVFVLPTYREGFPNACLEAACAELPVVTTTATGAVDSVVEGETGLLIPARDPEALVAAIEKLLDDADLRRRMGRKGRERAERDFKPEVIWEALLDLYSTMLRARGLHLPRQDT
jgi:glycosyltransferase involved in cell wall biosynthesis